MASRGQRRTAVKNADIVEAEKPTFEEASAEPVLAVHPPAEIRRELTEHPRQKIEIGLAPHRLLHAVEKDRCPGLHRRIDVTEIPLVGGNLSGRMQVDLAEQQVELLFGEIDVDGGQGKRMERQVPGREPG